MAYEIVDCTSASLTSALYRKGGHGQSTSYVIWPEHFVYGTVPSCTFRPQSRSTPVWAHIYKREQFSIINRPALSEGTLSAKKRYFMHLVHFRSLSGAENVKHFMRESCLACFSSVAALLKRLQILRSGLLGGSVSHRTGARLAERPRSPKAGRGRGHCDEG